MPKAYSYVRFSTPEQQQGDSLRRQVDLARAYAAAHKLQLDDRLTFQDLGISAFRGANAETGRLGDFLEAVRKGLVDRGSYLLVESLDRISRLSARRALRVLESIVDEGITVVTLSDNRVYTSKSMDEDPTSLLMSLLVFIRANEESAMKGRRLAASWAAKRAKADETPLTERAPGWLSLDKANRRWKVIPERANIVRQMFKKTLAGIGYNAIAQELNREKVKTFGGAKYWHRTYVRKILENVAVVGTFIPNKVEYRSGKRVRVPLESIKDYYPAIVDEAVFKRVQALFKSGRKVSGRHASKPLQNLLSGLARCPKCDGTMTRVSKGRNERAYLVCVKAHAKAGCTYKAVHYEAVEKAIVENVRPIIADCPVDDGSLQAEFIGLEEEFDTVVNQIQNIGVAIARSPSPTLSEKLHHLESRLEQIREERAAIAAKAAIAAGPLLRAKLTDLREALVQTMLDRGRANTVLRQLVSHVTIDYTDGSLIFNWTHGGTSEVTYAAGEIFPKVTPAELRNIRKRGRQSSKSVRAS